MVEINNKTKQKIDLALVKKVTEIFLKKYKRAGCEVSIAFVGDAVMRRLNKTYRGYDKTTDVLTFQGEDDFLGEIIIDYKQIEKQARAQKHPAKKELVFILVHGLFHLLGYTDETEEKRLEMIRMGEEFIEKFLIL